jgi:hypothetical protein
MRQSPAWEAVSVGPEMSGWWFITVFTGPYRDPIEKKKKLKNGNIKFAGFNNTTRKTTFEFLYLWKSYIYEDKKQASSHNFYGYL